jgi:GTP-binding protein EngB required for normal cell division
MEVISAPRDKKYYWNLIRRNWKKFKHATVGSSKPKPTFIQSKSQPKLDAIEQIRSDLHSENIEVPGIVVAGAQSSGKSSLLENLSNISLPSGDNITTRVPLILRLERDTSIQERYALISDSPDLASTGIRVKISNLSNKINEYTIKQAGADGTVVDKPIHVKVVSPDGPSMTLIDLPGITHLSLHGVQADIHKETSDLVKKYISNEQMIILCVVPAIDDFANSEAIKLAKSVDPLGKRTLGIVTKVDLCKSDTRIAEKLRGEGNNVRLDLGFVAVRNRSQDDIARGISISKMRELEKHFFETSSHFISVDKQYWGIDTVINRVSDMQTKSIDEFIPKIIHELSSKKKELQFQYDKLAPEFGNDVQKVQHMLRIVIGVVTEFKALAKSIDDCLEDTDLHISPRTNELYKRFYSTLHAAQPDFTSPDFSEKVRVAIEETKSIMLFNFMSHVAFNQLYVESHIKVYRDACNQLVDDAYAYIIHVLDYIIDKQLKDKYPPLLEATKLVVHDFMDKQKDDLLHIVHNIIDSEFFIFTQSTEYANKVKAIEETEHISFIQHVLKIYSDIAMSRICDLIPMQCHLFLVISVYKHLHEYVDLDKMSKHLIIDQSILNKRKDINKSVSRFQNALDVLESI